MMLLIKIKRLIDKILLALPWLKPKKDPLTKKGVRINREEKENKKYRYKVACTLYVTNDGVTTKDSSKKMLSDKIYEDVDKQEAIKEAFVSMYNYYQSIHKKAELKEDELIIDFEDGMLYKFAEPEIILIKDDGFKQAMRKANKFLLGKA